MLDFYDLRRRVCGMSLAECAAYLEVSPKTVRRWEDGHTTPPRAAVLALQALGGDLSAYGPAWRGWRIIGDTLYTPANLAIRAGEVASVPYLHSLISELQRTLAGSGLAAVADTDYDNVQTLRRPGLPA